jgi:hypothetical protein
MPDPISAFALSAVDTLNKLWDRSLTLLSALAVICALLLGISALGVFFHVGIAADLGSILPWLVGGAVVFGVLSVAKIIERRLVRTLHLIPDDQSSFWNKAPSTGGKSATQLSLHFRATNLTGRPLLLSDITIKRPWTFGAPIVKTLATFSAQMDNYDQEYFVHARGTTTAHSVLLIERGIGTAGKPLKVIVDLVDQRGNRTRLKYRKLQSRQ